MTPQTTPALPATSTDPQAGGRADGPSSDAAVLLLAYRAGDPGALDALMRYFGRMMSATARRYLRSPHDVEDAVQDAWISFARAAHTIEHPAAVAGWLRVTTARAALAIANRQGRTVLAGESLEVVGGARAWASQDEERPGADDLATLRAAVSRLDGRDRELLVLLFESDLSYAEVSARLGRPLGSIGPTRQRVMAKLRRDQAIRRLGLQHAS